MAERKRPDDPPPMSAPLYMVSFGDMITIMLTFFILLCSYAKEREAGFVADGVGSFQVVINAMGLPGLMPGIRHPVDLGTSRVRFKPAEAINYELVEDSDGNSDDLNRDRLRRVVKDTLKENQVVRLPVVFVFDFQETKLSSFHENAVDVIAPVLADKNVGLRIEGFGYEEELDPTGTRRVAWERAHAVAERLVSEHGIDPKRIEVLGHGSSGSGVEKRSRREVQERLGRRIAIVYLVPEAR